MQTHSSNPLNALLAIGLCVLLVFGLKACFAPGGPLPVSFNALPEERPAPPSEESLEAAAIAKVVVEDFDIKLEDRYFYVRGSVINRSSHTVGYWKVTANFMNKKGKIMDSGFTNALETLLPGASKRFEIMHETLPGLADMRCYVEEVRFKD